MDKNNPELEKKTPTTPAPATLDDLAAMIHQTNISKGFWEKDENGELLPRNFGEMCALITSEVSEALEEHRAGRDAVYFKPDQHGVYKPEGFHIELIDALIRILDTLKGTGCPNIEELLMYKYAYNTVRPPKHGKLY